jgi:hypothetical protein
MEKKNLPMKEIKYVKNKIKFQITFVMLKDIKCDKLVCLLPPIVICRCVAIVRGLDPKCIF